MKLATSRIKTGRRHAVPALVVAFVLLAAGVAGAQARRDAIRLGYGYNIFSVVPTAAERLGIFDKYGLDVTLIPQPRAQLGIESLVGGTAEFATALSNRLVFAAAQRLPVVAIGLVGWGYAGQVIVPARDETSRTMHDLVGKRFGAQEGSATYGTLVAYWKTLGLSPGDFRIVNLDVENIPAAFEAGQLDGALVWHPYTAQITSRGIGRVLLSQDDIAGPVQATYPVYLLSNPRYVRENPDVTQRLLLAWTEAVHWVETNREAALDIAVDFYRSVGLELDREVVAAMLEETRFDRVRVSDVDLRDLVENTAKPYIEMGRLGEIPDMGPYVDNTFAERALAELGLEEPFRP